MTTDASVNLYPSTTLHERWVFLSCPGQVFESTDLSGKWCIFRNADGIDSAWTQVVALVAAGALRAAKVSTRMSIARGGYDRHVICVYTRDWRNQAEVQQARQVLRGVGFSERLGYKRDSDTIAGIERLVYES
jgi:hypothetical protein